MSRPLTAAAVHASVLAAVLQVACATSPGGSGGAADRADDGYDDVACLAAIEDPACVFGSDVRRIGQDPSLQIGEIQVLHGPSDADALREAQILAVLDDRTANGLGDLFELIGDRGVEVTEVTYVPTSEAFTTLRFPFGAFEVGAVFRRGTTDRVAAIDGRDVHSCTVFHPEPFDHRCGATAEACSMWDSGIGHCLETTFFDEDCFQFAPPFVALEACCLEIDGELGLCERVPAPGECLFGDFFPHAIHIGAFDFSPGFVLAKDDPVTDLQMEQIIAGMALLGNTVTTVEEAFESTDDRLFFVSDLISRATDHPPFTLYSYHAGDNPMSFVFIEDTTELVAGIGDDSVFACTVFR